MKPLSSVKQLFRQLDQKTIERRRKQVCVCVCVCLGGSLSACGRGAPWLWRLLDWCDVVSSSRGGWQLIRPRGAERVKASERDALVVGWAVPVAVLKANVCY